MTYPNRTHRREYLTDLFWSKEDINAGRNALNTALWRLRKLLEEHSADSKVRPRSVAEDVVLELDDPTIVDVHDFEQIASRLLNEPDELACSGDLTRTVANYRGRFLDGEDDLWVIEERERLHCLYVRVLTSLMQRFAAAERYEEALECGRNILREDPLREIVQRNVILLYVLNGQRAEAIQQFERCRDLLLKECNVDPMPQTAALADLIRSGSVFDQMPELMTSFFGSPAQA